MAVVDFDNQKHFIQKERIKKRGKEKRYRVYMYIYITAKKRKKKKITSPSSPYLMDCIKFTSSRSLCFLA